MMDEKDCLILRAIDQEQNLGRAAKKLFLSAPALTYRIQQLEERFSVPIIKRNGNQIYFTPEGKRLVHYAEKMLRDLKQLKDSLLGIHGTLRIGVASVYAFSRLPAILDGFFKMHPEIKTQLNSDFSERIFNLLTSGTIHLGIVRGDYEWTGPRHLIQKGSISLVSKHEISIEDLPVLPYIKVNHPASKNFSERLDDWWTENFTSPPAINHAVNDFQTAIALVKKDMGYAIVPSIFITDDTLFTKKLTFSGGQPFELNTWLLYTDESAELLVVEKFIKHIKSIDSTYL